MPLTTAVVLPVTDWVLPLRKPIWVAGTSAAQCHQLARTCGPAVCAPFRLHACCAGDAVMRDSCQGSAGRQLQRCVLCFVEQQVAQSGRALRLFNKST